MIRLAKIGINYMKNAIIIGASSGIGKEVALQLSSKGYRLCLAARRKELLEKLLLSLHPESFIQEMDISNTEASIRQFNNITKKMGVVDLIIISAGTGYIDAQMPWENDKKTIEVNVNGFTSIANATYHLFEKQGHGHLAGISSIAAIRGGSTAAYNASKAYISSYLVGLRSKAAKDNISITITDIRPGLVDTNMAQGEGLFWVAPPKKAAKQIISALETGKKLVYVTKRWRLIAMLLKILPDALYNRL